MMIRFLLLATIIISLNVSARAADLDQHYRPALPPIIYAPNEVYEARPPERIYTRPVVGFYGYPYDVGIPRPHPDFRSVRPIPEPYVLDRTPPHVVDID